MQFRFQSYVLDTEGFELWHGDRRIAVEPQVLDVLGLLIRHRDRVVSQEELFESVWGGRAVSISTLTSRINAVRQAVGDNGLDQRVIRTIPRRGYRFIAKVDSAEEVLQKFTLAPGDRPQAAQFCTGADGVRIAYARIGQGAPLVKAGNWLNHLDYDWESPIWSPLLHWLASEHELIRYDARGNGLSDWEVGEITFDDFVKDLETVVDAAGLDRFTLFGVSQGVAVSVAYAVRHPERVNRMVLYGGFARGRRLRGGDTGMAQAEALVTLMRTGWGQENPAFRQLFTSMFVPGGTPEQMSWFNNLQKVTTSPDNAVKMRLVSDHMDVRELLPQVRVPTLVMHCRDDAVQPFEEGRILAAAIPGARFVPLEGRNHLILETDPGWPRFKEEAGAFFRG
jgi:pimeloyl-ACP methyl ester carboxylesterase/DNA-binding winged helix-turn-helix (wHTH) protein